MIHESQFRFYFIIKRLTSYILSNGKYSSKGFSLIELLVAFTLISIVSGIGFASFAEYSNRQVAVQASANLKQAIDLTRYNSISSVKPPSCSDDALEAYRFRFCGNASCFTTGADYEMTVVCGGENVIQSTIFPDSLQFVNPDGASPCSTITFNVLSGVAEGIPCEIELDGNGTTLEISIDSLGHVSY